MQSTLKFAFEPLKIKSMEIENRIGMPSMHLNFTPKGEINDKFISFYKERAKGDVGLIVIGGCSIDDTAGGGYLVGLHDDKFIPGLKQLTDTVHRVSNTKIAAQLYHAGRYAMSFFIGKKPVAPSAVASKLTREIPKELTIEEIKTIEDDFAEAAYRAKRAGFDAVEILNSAGYLIPQFLSPLTNLRNDEYGGSFENRMRFGIEVIEKVKEAVGPNYPIMMRQGGSDFMRGGNSSSEIVEIIKIFADVGVDLINVTGGWHETHVPQIAGVVPNAGFAYLAAGIKRATNKPVIISNRVSTIELAEKLIRDGWGDMVNLGRPLIADPYIVKKAKEGRLKEIRPCISCNQLCFDAIFTGKEVGCTVNPLVGKENEGFEINKNTGINKKLVVIGAGAGGLSAAIAAAERGHNVIVFEKSEKVGGQLYAASAPPDKREFAKLIDYYKHEAKRLNIEIRTNVEVGIQDIEKENPDRIVVATGAHPIIPKINNIDSINVVKAEDVLLGKAALGNKIVIVGGGAVGVDIALYILEQARINGEQASFLLRWEAETCEQVTNLLRSSFKDIAIIEMLDDVGKDIGKTTRWIALKELKRSGVKIYTKTTVEGISESGVLVKNENGSQEIPADTIVISVGYESNDTIVEELKKRFKDKVYVIGDAKKVRKLPDAIHEGFKVGQDL